MNFLRKFALVIITPIFILLLYAAAFDMGVMRVVSQPSNVKQVLHDSGIYNTAVNSLLDQAKQQSSDTGSVDLTNPVVKSAANATFTPQYIQAQTETVINNIYAWLNGQTPQPEFSIGLSSLKEQFANNVAQAVEKQAATLPTCTDEASTTAALNDPVNATCLPAGTTPAAVASEVQGSLVGGQGFLDNTNITADSITVPKNACVELEGSTCPPAQKVSVFKNQLKDAPKQYQRAKKVPIALAVLAFLLAVIIVFLSSSRRKGLRHAGILLLIVGVFMLVFAWGLNTGTSKALPKLKLDNTVLQTDVRKVITDLEQKIDQNYWIFGGVYTVLGLLAIAAAVFWPGAKGKAKDDLMGEGKTADDRIDLRAPDTATNLSEAKTKPKTSTKTTSNTKPTETKSSPAKKNIQVK